MDALATPPTELTLAWYTTPFTMVENQFMRLSSKCQGLHHQTLTPHYSLKCATVTNLLIPLTFREISQSAFSDSQLQVKSQWRKITIDYSYHPSSPQNLFLWHTHSSDWFRKPKWWYFNFIKNARQKASAYSLHIRKQAHGQYVIMMK